MTWFPPGFRLLTTGIFLSPKPLSCFCVSLLVVHFYRRLQPHYVGSFSFLTSLAIFDSLTIPCQTKSLRVYLVPGRLWNYTGNSNVLTLSYLKTTNFGGSHAINYVDVVLESLWVGRPIHSLVWTNSKYPVIWILSSYPNLREFWF